MTAQTIWEAMKTPEQLREFEVTIAKYFASLEQSARNAEVDAIMSGLLLGSEISDELRLAATQFRRAAKRADDIRIEIRVRIRELEKQAQP